MKIASTVATGGELLRSRRYTVAELWHLLSLDAPTVAALWTAFLAQCCHVALPWSVPLALAVAVWMLYAADRLADANAGSAQEERHRFHQRHRVLFAACWLLCAPLLLWLVVRLPHEVRDGWLLLAIPLAAYVGAVHAFRAGSVPKEPLIAAFFGVAVTVPVLGRVSPATAAAAGGSFALACWLNCAAIAAWESPGNGYVDPATRFLGRHFYLAAVAVFFFAFWIGLAGNSAREIAAAAAGSVIGLMLLQRRREHMDRTRLRVLADAALLTPILFLAWRAR